MSSKLDNFPLMYCGICKFVLKDPVLTPCLHSFCKSCLETPPSDRNLSSGCDSCSQFIAGLNGDNVESLEPNSFIETLASLTDPHFESIKCKVCERVGQETQPVTHFCTDCDELMCEGCFSGHNKYLRICHEKLTLAEYQSMGGKHYRDSDVRTGANVCKTHPKSILKLFCKACEEFFCKGCVEENVHSRNSHCQHILHDVKIVAKEYRKSVARSLSIARENLITTQYELSNLTSKMISFNREQRKAIEDMDTQRAKLVELANKLFQESKRILLERAEKHMAQVNKQRNQLETHLDDLSRLISRSSSTLDMIPDVELMNECSELKRKLEVVGPGIEVVKFEFCKLLQDERLAAHVKSALGCFVEHKVFAVGDKSERHHEAVYVKATDSIVLGTDFGLYEICTSGRRQIDDRRSACLSLSEDQRKLYSGSDRTSVRVFEIEGEFKYSHTIYASGYRSRAESLSVSPGGRLAVIGYGSPIISVIDTDGSWSQITLTPRGFCRPSIWWVDDDTICLKKTPNTRTYTASSISFNPLHHDQHTMLWTKDCPRGPLYCAGGMIFLTDWEKQTLKVWNRHGDDVGSLTSPEGVILNVCTMGNGMLMAIYSLSMD